MGTLDISVCDLSMVEGQLVAEILASYGDVFLGGQNFDNAIVEWLCDEYKKNHANVDLKKDPMAYSRLIEAAEKAKCELSSTTATEINLPYISVQDGVPQHLVVNLSRAKFDQLTEDLVGRIIECTRKAFEKANKGTSEINEILLVGGTTRMLSIQEALTKEFGLPLDKSSNPDEAVALGAVTQANILVGGDASKDILLLDVTPLSLGLETEGAVMTKLIEANTTIPTSKKQVFTTASDNQGSVLLNILQGERQFSKDNKQIGTFMLDGIMPARRGVPQIEVTFDIDANGILKVSAKDLGTGKEQHITITSQNSLSKEEIERIKADAEAHAAEDAKKKEEVDKLNRAESYAYQVRGALEDEKMKDEFTEDQKKDLTEKYEAVIKAVEAKDLDGAEAAKKTLEDAFNPIIAAIYQKNAPKQEQAPQQEQTTQNESKNDNVEDAEFEEVD